jgi:hypothetical protein
MEQISLQPLLAFMCGFLLVCGMFRAMGNN